MPTIHIQLGAREHYAIPRALHAEGQLTALLTEAWSPPGSVWQQLPGHTGKALAQRYHPELAEAPVYHFTPASVAFELQLRLSGKQGWEAVIARNDWFQKRVLQKLQQLDLPAGPDTTLFAYSYAAEHILRYARKQGWQTILGQIDPGPEEETIVAEEHARYPQLQDGWQPAPPSYWEAWRRETELADRIQVNSDWSRQALIRQGIPEAKLFIEPLLYEPPPEARDFQRHFPKKYTAERPLRVLFLGQVILRKGIARILEAAPLLEDLPVELHIVGPVHPSLRAAGTSPILHFHGPVSRQEVAQWYQKADLFLFPTLSDGFGLTQLEAKAWQLPVIASRYCGQVVEDGITGVVLEEVTGSAIAEAIGWGMRFAVRGSRSG